VIRRARREDTTPGAVVTGASYRALAVVRSLGRHGIPVRVVRSDEHTLAERSRYAASRERWPAGDEGARVRWLIELARREGLDGWVLIPTHDEEAVLIARHRNELASRYRVTTPPWERLRAAYDKRGTHALAAGLGLEQPWTLCPRSADDLAAADGHFPVIVKPAFKAAVNRLTTDKAWRADHAEDLRRRYAEACRLVEREIVMVQELVPGDGDGQLSVAALCSEGRVDASVTARRRRQYPMDFGRASTYVETVEDPQAAHAARALLAAMRWTGIVEVEFKRDARTGATKLLDVNPRAWGWQSLCGRAGVDFPYLLWRMAAGLPLPPISACPGVRWVRVSTDIAAVAGEMRAGRMSVRSYVRSLRGPLEFAVFAPDDPLPAILAPLLAARLAAGRAMAHHPL
jgi:D-aspartate ligase